MGKRQVYLRQSYPRIKANGTLDLEDSAFQLCDICSEINLDEVAQWVRGPDHISRGQEHHKSWAHLKAAAVSGCHLCKIFYFAKTESEKQSLEFSGSRLQWTNLHT